MTYDLTEPGVFVDVSFEDYRAIEAINASSIKSGRKSLLHMNEAMSGRGQSDTKALNLGTLAHLAVLEWGLFKECPVWDGGAKRGKEWTAFKAENEGKTFMSQDERDAALSIRDAVLSHDEAARLVVESRHEVSIHWHDEMYSSGKARLDMLGSDFICDLKTCADVTYSAFRNQFAKLGYHIQYGWQGEGLENLGAVDGSLSAYCVCAESKAPWDVCVYEIEPSAMEQGRREAVELAKAYHVDRLLVASGAKARFDGVTGGEILPMGLPVWAMDDEIVVE